MTSAFRVEVLGAGHARDGFSCGAEALDIYFARQATQDVRRRASACYVAVEVGSGKVAGYYTLAAGGVPLTDLSEAMSKRLPRYPSVPVARVGRLAVDQAFHGQKLGGALLADRSGDRLLAFDAKVIVPGHGPASTEARQDIQLTRDYLAYLRQAMGAAARDMTPFDEAYQATDWSAFAHLPLFGAANRMNAYNTYLLMEHAGP